MGLRENLRQERVKELPLRESLTVSEDTKLRSVIELMREKHLGSVMVVNAEGKPLGTFTERTLIELLLKDSVAWESLPVKQCVDKLWFTVQLTTPIRTVMELVCEEAARFICVTDADGHAVALTGQKGLAEYVADHYPRQVMVQRISSKPGVEDREGA